MKIEIPQLTTNNEEVNRAFRIAVSDITANIIKRKDGTLTVPEDVIYAGLGYDKPWTRDTAINVWNGCGILFPEALKKSELWMNIISLIKAGFG